MRRPDSNSVERCAPYPGFRRKTPDLHSCLRRSKSILNPPDSSSNRMRREARRSELSHATTQRRDLIFVAADKTRAAVRKDACGLSLWPQIRELRLLFQNVVHGPAFDQPFMIKCRRTV